MIPAIRTVRAQAEFREDAMPGTSEYPTIELSSDAKPPPLTPAERRWLAEFRASLLPPEDPPERSEEPHWGWIVGFWVCAAATALLASLG